MVVAAQCLRRAYMYVAFLHSEQRAYDVSLSNDVSLCFHKYTIMLNLQEQEG